MCESIRIPAIFFAIALAAAGCTRDAPPASSGGMDMPSASFTSRYSLVDTVVLEQPDTLPIVRISGVDRAPDGTLVLSDPSEAMVKIFAPDGRLLRVLGRKGRGPGEFLLPEFPRFAPDGSVHVVDGQMQRITVFGRDGRLARHVSLREFMRISDFEVLPDGGYLLSGFRLGRDPHVLFRTDATGKVVSSHLPVATYVPAGARPIPAWTSVRRPSIALHSGQALAVLSIADSLWTVDMANGTVRGQRVAPPDYVRPQGEPAGGVPGLLKWSKSFSTTASVLSTDGVLLIPFVRGVMNDGDPISIAHQERDGGWTALSQGPPLLRAVHGEVIAFHTPGQDRVVLARYRAR